MADTPESKDRPEPPTRPGRTMRLGTKGMALARRRHSGQPTCSLPKPWRTQEGARSISLVINLLRPCLRRKSRHQHPPSAFACLEHKRHTSTGQFKFVILSKTTYLSLYLLIAIPSQTTCLSPYRRSSDRRPLFTCLWSTCCPPAGARRVPAEPPPSRVGRAASYRSAAAHTGPPAVCPRRGPETRSAAARASGRIARMIVPRSPMLLGDWNTN